MPLALARGNGVVRACPEQMKQGLATFSAACVYLPEMAEPLTTSEPSATHSESRNALTLAAVLDSPVTLGIVTAILGILLSCLLVLLAWAYQELKGTQDELRELQMGHARLSGQFESIQDTLDVAKRILHEQEPLFVAFRRKQDQLIENMLRETGHEASRPRATRASASVKGAAR